MEALKALDKIFNKDYKARMYQSLRKSKKLENSKSKDQDEIDRIDFAFK